MYAAQFYNKLFILVINAVVILTSHIQKIMVNLSGNK